MHEPILSAPDDERPEAVIAGTLCLMSCYVQHPIAVYADRVADNLRRMARLAALSPELRTICGRLATRWAALRAQAATRASAEVPDGRALH